ncbi:transglutaminase-like domain-containing protein [Deltaproteobacteria bacterium TL4]
MSDIENTKGMQRNLQATAFIDSDSFQVTSFARQVTAGETSPVEKAIKLYYAVRDGIKYDPYKAEMTRTGLKASFVLEKKYGNCISKAVALAAVARAEGIPSRLGFADVKNHLATGRFLKLLRSDIFRYHGYTELYLEGKWVKATPAFNLALCEHFNVAPLDFNGKEDSVFQEYDQRGNHFMEYVNDHGQYDDLPYEQIGEAFRKYYFHLTTEKEILQFTGDYEQEVIEQTA